MRQPSKIFIPIAALDKIKPLVTLLLSLFIVAFVAMPPLKLVSLHTTFYDLGFYFNDLLFYEGKIEGIPHLNLFYPIFSMVYKVFPHHYSPYILLISQSIFLLFFLFLVFRHYGLLISFFCFFSYPFWYANLFDFHFEFLSVIFLTCFFISHYRGKTFLAVLFAISLAITKDVYTLTALMCGVYILAACLNPAFSQKYCLVEHNKKIALSCGILLIAFSVFYFILVNLLSHSNVPLAESDTKLLNNASINYYHILNNYFYSFFDRVMHDPEIIFKFLIFSILPLLAFGLLPLKNPLPLLICFPTILVAILSPSSLHRSINNHYSIILLPALCHAAYFGVLRNNYPIFSFLKLPIAVAFLVSPMPLSIPFISGLSWSANYSAYFSDDRDRIIIDALSRIFQADNTTEIQIQNNINYPILFNRKNIKVFSGVGESVNDSHPGYYVFDLKRPLFIGDQSCQFRLGSCTDIDFAQKFNMLFNQILNTCRVVYSYDGFYVLVK